MAKKATAPQDQFERMQIEKACELALKIKKNASTYFRWAKKGVIGRDGNRHFLAHNYVGRQIYTTIFDVLEFDRAINAPVVPPAEPKPYEATKPAGIMHRRSNAKRLAALGMVPS